ncbi:O-antigen ligase family protein [Parvibaculum sp.]|uniref:O-antigen ligase family protein n=1 Tax=Parvibaculum sp. TaxID=2024848 RepID=UPI001DE0C69D|nr:O-antigen ligase family protein [Parvibaculum sp.]MBX3489219.1 O-antigen ligase family protein [Parvibaculum sp.]
MTPAPKSIHLRRAFWGLMLLIAWAPMPLGSNRPWSAALLAGLAGLLLIGLAAGNFRAGSRPAVDWRRLRLPLGLAGVAIAWAIVQWSTWTPEIWHHPVWQQAATALDMPVKGRITVNPDATLSALMNLMGYLAVFWVTLETAQSRRRATLALTVFVGIAAAYAAYGLAVFFAGNETILFMRKWDYFDALTSTFVNRNSYATYAGLGLLCAVGLLLDKARNLAPRGGVGRPLASRLNSPALLHLAPLLVAALIIGTALVLTGSRAGVAATAAALLALPALAMLGGRGSRLRHIIVALPVLATLLAILLFAGNPLMERFEKDPLATDRLPAFALSLSAVEDAPWLGTGYGAFHETFASYRDLSVSSPSSWKKAHNTYLENMLGLGVPAAISLNLAIFLVAARALRVIPSRRKSRVFPTLAVAATVLVGLHALVDFSLEIPAVAATYAFIMGIGAAHAFRADDTTDSGLATDVGQEAV